MGKNKHKEKITLDRDNLKYYYGIPHCHTSFSTGKGNPSDAYDYGRKAGLDFMCITDHNSYLNNKVLIKGEAYTKWDALQLYVAKIKKKYPDFLPIAGFECKSIYGDLNIINPSTFFSGSIRDIKLLALWMFNNPNAFVTINHPHKNIKLLKYNKLLNKIIPSIEVCNGTPNGKYTYHYKYYYYLLDNNWNLGALNSQDNHKFNFGDSQNLTVYIGNELSTPALVDAFRCKRVYSTESRFLKFHFTINDSFMGERIALDENKLKFSIFAEDIRYRIKEIQIISNNGLIIRKIEDINLNYIKYIYEHIYSSNESWYVIKVLQENNITSWSSPIFISQRNLNN